MDSIALGSGVRVPIGNGEVERELPVVQGRKMLKDLDASPARLGSIPRMGR